MVHCLLVGLPCFSTITKFQKIGSVQSLFLLGRTIHVHPTHRIDFKSVDWNANRQSGSCKASVQQTIQIEVMTTNQAGSKEQQICCSRVLKTGVTPGHSRSIFGWVTTMSFWGKSIVPFCVQWMLTLPVILFASTRWKRPPTWERRSTYKG
jgi:hypothetical protein